MGDKAHKTIQEEPALNPEQVIIDPHLHLWDIPPVLDFPDFPSRFLLREVADTIANSGHNITHTVFVECHAMYRQAGPEDLKSLGETEFANGMAAMSASGGYGACRVAHRILGAANMFLGAEIAPLLDAHMAVAGERFRGIRQYAAYSETGLFGHPCDPALQGMLLNPALIDAAKVLAEKGLNLDVWCLHTQLNDLMALADAVPELLIVLDHLGTPDFAGVEKSKKASVLTAWKVQLQQLAQRPNVRIKLGGLGMDISGGLGNQLYSKSSAELAGEWRPYIEYCVEAFSPGRCMFESNFPPDRASSTYGALWNAFKLVAGQYSQSERDNLFYKVAADTYRISVNQ